VEGKLERGGQKVIEGARQRTQRALRGELADAVRSGDLNEAENTWTELRARTGSRLDEASCHTLMNAYAQRGHLRRALSLYARMKEWRVRPSAHTFSILFNAYANLAQPSPAYLPKLKQLKDQEMPKYVLLPLPLPPSSSFIQRGCNPPTMSSLGTEWCRRWRSTTCC
jgi:pentatricopeptide repeat protein